MVKRPMLTERERQVIVLLRGGKAYKAIAAELGIKVPTARVLGARALAKLGRSRLSLLA